MRRSALCVLLALFGVPPRAPAALTAAGNTASLAADASARLASDRAAREAFATALLTETNRVRQLKGLRPLRARAELDAAADDQAAYMQLLLTAQHTSPIKGQGTPVERVQRHGLEIENVGLAENVASLPVGAESEPPMVREIAAQLVEQWMNSPGHRANLLSRDFTQLGGSVRVAHVLGRSWVAFGVQVFFRPRDRFGRGE